MGNTAILAVKFLGDSTGASKALDQLTRDLQQAEQATEKSGKKMGAIWAGVATAMGFAVREASKLEQATGAVNQIFGEGADDITAWAEGMARYGLSTAEASAAAAILGAQLQNLGIPMEHVATVTTKLIELGADMAAVFGGSVPQAIGALGAALRGEFDTLERYGITLTADTVAAEAQRLAAEGVTFASEQQAKVVATLALIWQQTADIQGAAAEETDTLASATDYLFSSVKNLAAQVGGALAPVLADLINTVADVITKFTDWWNESETVQGILDALTGIVDSLQGALEALQPVIDKLMEWFDRLVDLLDPVVINVLDAVAGALDTISGAISDVIGWIQDAINWFNNLIDSINEAWDKLTFWNDNATVESPDETAAVASLSAAGRAGAIPAPVTINIHGAVDAEGTARQIRRLLAESDHRRGHPRPVGIYRWPS